MTIVASNSITVSNVNDGTITHIAYAYSASGTDRFTTVYPNLNLLQGTNAQSPINSSWKDIGSAQISLATDEKAFISSLTPSSSTQVGLWQEGVAANIGATYTISALIKNMSSYAFQDFRLVLVTRGNNTNIYPKSFVIPNDNQYYYISFSYQVTATNVNSIGAQFYVNNAPSNIQTVFRTKQPKLELGATATPWMPSSSEVTTADWPSYIGQYSDFTSTASTDPAKYAPWTVFKGKDGATGPQGPQGLKGDPGETGIPGQAGADGKTSYLHIAYATNSTGTAGFDVSNATGKTYIGQYTDFTSADSTDPSKYKWSLIKGDKGDQGIQGLQGPAGSNGAPGKIVSDTEPTTRFKGLTWKYSGSADMTASDGTVIHPNTEYYYNGTHWVINYFSVNNFAAESITSDKIDGKNLTISDGEFVSTTTNGSVTTSTEIKYNHIAISKTDGTVNTRNDIALDSEQGLAQKFTNIDTGFYRTAGINYQGPFTSDSDGNYAQLTPQGTKLSTDVPWTILSPLGGFSGGLIRFAVKNGVAHFSLAGLSCPSMTAGNWIKCAQLPTGSIAIPSENQVTAAFTNATVWGFYVSKSGGLYLQSTSNSPALNGLVNASNSFPIG